jgi:hypothetical protein
VVDIVLVMDALNRFRFADDSAILAEWETVSNIVGPPRSTAGKTTPPVEPPTGGEVRPAA